MLVMASYSARGIAADLSLQKWQRGWDSNPRRALALTPLAGERLQPLGHLSTLYAFNLTRAGLIADQLFLSYEI